MEVVRDIERLEPPAAAVAVGVFDGVHLGHQAVLREAVTRAAGLGAQAAALTFDPHPQQVLRPRQAPRLLTTIAERAALIADSGINMLIVARFDHSFAAQTPEEFVHRVLLERLGARCVIAGEGFVFGRGARGNIHTLTELGRRLGFCAAAVERVTVDGMTVSSTAVRQLISAGNIERATSLLGHCYTIGGVVVRGRQRGRAIGTPTANLCVEQSKLLPPDGVYAVRARLRGEEGARPAVANIGTRPTFAGATGEGAPGGRCIEAHMFDSPTPGELYGHALTLEVVSRLRDERAFPSAPELSAQIQQDIACARAILARK
ncbi:MAG TPA: bifunctional riboflavin kinase/FAD synthetase [Armatimonadota bacterium]|nr:bifunctional riboflavin kinase/FAD synthetase [Armatimonadota bacterium]